MTKFRIGQTVRYSEGDEHYYGTVMKIEITASEILYYIRFAPGRGRSNNHWVKLDETENLIGCNFTY